MTTAFTIDDHPHTDTGARHHALLTSQAGQPLELRLVRALNREWGQLCELPSSDQAVAQWAAPESALPPARSLAELVAAMDAAAPDKADAMLLALLALAQRGEQLAGRVLVHQFMGRAVRLAVNQVRVTGAESHEVEAQVFAGLWQAVMDYPIGRRRQRVAANLALEALRLTQQHWVARWGQRREDHRSSACTLPALREVQLPLDEFGDALSSQSSEQTGPTSTEDVLLLLTDAVAHAVISREEAQLLARAYAPTPGMSSHSAAIGADWGLTATAVRRRLSRLVSRLAQYVRELEAESRVTAACLTSPPAGTARLGAHVLDLMRAA
ncbi:hypothetical protein [Kineococcus sp. SYSU DK003]|uniref:hypothetical protein n=1 Tax=Kineococcus sp. SYSU DK003 TaxID=3383124 RepID=UPI003D7CD292